MSRCAVVSSDTKIIQSIIVAEPTDIPYEGTYLVLVAEDVFCDIGWLHDPITNTFIDPNPPIEE